MAGVSSCAMQVGDGAMTANWKVEAELWKARYESTRSELDEFTESSLELEQELEKELHLSIQQNKRLKNDLRISRDEIDALKENEGRFVTRLSLLESQLHNSDAQKHASLSRLRQLEQENDKLETENRNLTATINDYLGQVEELAESKAIIEAELEQTRNKQKENQQRLEDQIKDLKDEMVALQKRFSAKSKLDSQEVTSRTAMAIGNTSINNSADDNDIIMLRLLANGDYDQLAIRSKLCRTELESNIPRELTSACVDNSASLHLLIDKFNTFDFLASEYGSNKAGKAGKSPNLWS